MKPSPNDYKESRVKSIRKTPWRQLFFDKLDSSLKNKKYENFLLHKHTIYDNNNKYQFELQTLQKKNLKCWKKDLP